VASSRAALAAVLTDMPLAGTLHLARSGLTVDDGITFLVLLLKSACFKEMLPISVET
jgi:hypothetical protein